MRIKAGLDRLYEAVEKASAAGRQPAGARPKASDATPGHPARDGRVRRRAELPLKTIGTRQVDTFARVLRGKLLGNKAFAKQYLRVW